ncbi:solute carrier family 25 member 46-like [Venturia canescens]|uniref:solute carrier family 25 member 46-like n=1 Tax=Venturia canescens TaxID=32260 RepID=UPI001C9BC47C|nr:solute carrier family 25 member 46-like [Venturia canescens]XP_043277148.1 solute carrier family 25 member 46-like [Venturia canescens]XP_043277149.1 solute carrier family 25 member 46-like [Venturia canescens]
MAGLDDYDRVYRGRPLDLRDPMSSTFDIAGRYQDREVIRPLDIPLIHPLAKDSPPPDDDYAVKRYVGLGCGLASLITENLLIHPFIVLRRQCQVNPGAQKYHLIPVTLIPVMVRLHQTQGLNTLWKGIGSVLLVRGMTLAVEDFISKITPWPKEITRNSSLRSFGQHILLKCVSIGIVTPFYSASLVETVQSEIASEKPGILDVFRDGAIRLLEVSNKGRLIPIYALLPPSIAYGVAKYLFALIVRGVTSRIMHIRRRHCEELRGACSREVVSEAISQDIELQSILVSICAADVVFYPLETVVHRLHLQGTRTIIDNLDTGRSVTPLLTGYSGAVDCYRTIISTEGPLGLYKGFGALVLQFAVHILVLKATKWILTEVGSVLKSKPKNDRHTHNTYYTEA